MTNLIRHLMLAAVLSVTAGCDFLVDASVLGVCVTNQTIVRGISATPTSLSLTPGASGKINLTVYDSTGAKLPFCAAYVQFGSSNPAVASVELSGSVDGSGSGQATVMGMSAGQTVIEFGAGGKGAEVQVTVTNPATRSMW